MLICATSGLYLSGMVFNDVFDRRADAMERPQRPIPSGRVSLYAAVIMGMLLMLLGVTAAALVGRHTLMVAVMLAACILGYDIGLKRTPLGPMAMGSCRFLNILMAASTERPRIGEIWSLPQVWVAAGMGVYIVGVTWFARTEARLSSRVQLALAAGIVNLGLTILLAWVLQSPNGQRVSALLALGVIVLTIDRRLLIAISDPVPALVQAAIKTALLSIIMLDATLIFARLGPQGVGYAIVVAALVVPALTLGRWIRLT
jgi:4-hydroxybenzoate polyprenyltransferase